MLYLTENYNNVIDRYLIMKPQYYILSIVLCALAAYQRIVDTLFQNNHQLYISIKAENDENGIIICGG